MLSAEAVMWPELGDAAVLLRAEEQLHPPVGRRTGDPPYTYNPVTLGTTSTLTAPILTGAVSPYADRTFAAGDLVIARRNDYSRADAIDLASAAFWQPADLHTQVLGAEPLTADESFVIPELTDDEWERFERALRG